MHSITCAGSISIDTTRTPFGKGERVLGGAASYFSLSSSYFAPTFICGVVGEDFPEEYEDLLSERADISSIRKIKGGKTFHFDSTFSYDLYHRQANKTELNVMADFEPILSERAKESEFMYLATMLPSKQLAALKQAKNPKLVFMDTMDYYIERWPDELKEAVSKVHGIILNDEEARMIAGERNLMKCGRKILSMGPRIAVIKKSEHGSLLFFGDKMIPFPAFPLEDIVDPTGAGDSFAGGFIGSLARDGAISPTISQLKSAMAYANVMGSLVVRAFSADRVVHSSVAEIEKLYLEYRELLRL